MTQTLQTALVVIGESAGGIVASVRAAREGVKTILVSYRQGLGGVMPSLGAIETHYPGNRTPLLQEIRERIITHYRTTYGTDSPQYRACVSLEPNNPMLTYEPHVLSNIFEAMVAEEADLSVIKGYYPLAVQRAGRLIQAVRLTSFDDGEDLSIEAQTFVDATYEGDLVAVTGIPYRLGRESRDDYNEPHAGRLFTRWDFSGTKYPIEASQGKLNILPKWSTLGIMAGSTGVGDERVQAYTYRLCLSNDPDNRIAIDKPDGYDRNRYLAISQSPDEIGITPYALHHRFLNNTLRGMVEQDHIFHGHALPNNKRSWNAGNFPGGNLGYLEGDWETRRHIADNHLRHGLSILYFLQNDETVPEDLQEQARQWGLAKDEFTNNGNVPEHLYVREGRRIMGRTTFTEHDNMLAHGIRRAPIHHDSIAITEFPIDSLACSPERLPGTLCDGQFFLMELSRPGQIPLRILLSPDVDNLLTPVATSSTHVAWGTVRQTPMLIHLSEATGFLVTLAHQQQVTPAVVNISQLQRALVEQGVMLSFFNDFDMATDQTWVKAVQYWGTKGFFSTYDACPNNPLDSSTASVWAETFALLLMNQLDVMTQARKLHATSKQDDAISSSDFIEQLDIACRCHGIHTPDFASVSHQEGDAPLSSGDACLMLYDALDGMEVTQ